jgi:hypothetical protein
MFSGIREFKWAIVSAGLTLVLVLAFQNCAPSLPDTDVRQLGGASVRPTPLPAATPAPTIGDTTYGGLPWEGSCTNDFATENMAVPGLEVPYIPLAVFRRAADGAVALWSHDYNGVRRGVVCKMNTSGWTVAGKGDFNGDTQTDIIWRHTDGRTAVWILNGSTRVGGGFSGNAPAGWALEATRDFDGDGKADIFWRNKSTDQVSMWLMNGATVKSTLPVGGGLIEDKWRFLGAGDFDGDRKGDLLMVDTTTDRLRIWFMDGATIRTNTNPSQEFATGYTFMGLGDFDYDGKTDMLWKTTANIVWWKMDSATRTEAILAANSGTATTWTFEYSQDVNGDGRADWIWTAPNTVTGMNAFAVTFNVLSGNSSNPPSTTFYNPIRPGWMQFQFEHP